MTVADLIAKLRRLPQDAPVLVSGYESGHTVIRDDSPRKVALHHTGRADDEPMGEFEDHDDGYCFWCEEGRPLVRAVVIER